MSTPIQDIPNGSQATPFEEDSSVVQSILDEIGAMDGAAAAASSASAGIPASSGSVGIPSHGSYEGFQSAAPMEDDMLEFGGEDGFYDEMEDLRVDAPPPSLKERIVQLVRLPIVVAAAMVLVSLPAVQSFLRDVVVARLPVNDHLRGLLARLVLPALLVAAVAGAADVFFRSRA